MRKTFFEKKQFYNYKHLLAGRPVFVYSIYSHKFPTCYLIFHRNDVTQTRNAGNVGIQFCDPVYPWP